MTPDERNACFRGAGRHLAYPPRPPAKRVLAELAAWCPEAARGDHYGAGGAVAELEARLVALTGKEAAVFMPSGTMAQQIALRIACDRRRLPRVAFHPLSHLELHEEDAYATLHGLTARKLGTPHRLMRPADLEACPEELAALLVELPQRELGGALPAWEELEDLLARGRERGMHLHCDGARLWECQPFYERDLRALCAPFDSVYLSFYKTLGALSGAALLGDADFCARARVWLRRHGGNLFGLWPNALSASRALDEVLPRIGEFVGRARELAELLAGLPGVRVTPAPPPTNMFRVLLEGDREVLLDAAAAIARDRDLALFRGLAPTEVPGIHATELAAGPGTCALDLAEVHEAWEDLLARARAAPGPR